MESGSPPPGDVTRLLRAWRAGDAGAADELIRVLFRDGVNTVATRIGAGHPTTRALCAAAATAGITVSDGPATCSVGDAPRGGASGRR